MGKRAILSAAKKRGITVVSAEYYWTVVPEERIAQWEIEFGPELDYEIEFFENSAEAVAFIESAELLTTQHQEPTT